MNNIESEYNSYGRLKSEIKEPIKQLDKVSYINKKIVNRKIVREVLVSYWLNGSAVFYDSDDNRIVVKTSEWLIKEKS